MNWSSTNATSCAAAGGWTGTKPPTGTLVVSPTSTTTYTLTCTGGRRHVASSQYDGSSECQPDAGQRRVRIGERHDGIVCTFGQPLHRRHGLVRGGLGPVDMELRRLQRRHQRDLHCVGGIFIGGGGDSANNTRSC